MGKFVKAVMVEMVSDELGVKGDVYVMVREDVRWSWYWCGKRLMADVGGPDRHELKFVGFELTEVMWPEGKLPQDGRWLNWSREGDEFSEEFQMAVREKLAVAGW